MKGLCLGQEGVRSPWPTVHPAAPPWSFPRPLSPGLCRSPLETRDVPGGEAWARRGPGWECSGPAQAAGQGAPGRKHLPCPRVPVSPEAEPQPGGSAAARALPTAPQLHAHPFLPGTWGSGRVRTMGGASSAGRIRLSLTRPPAVLAAPRERRREGGRNRLLSPSRSAM